MSEVGWVIRAVIAWNRAMSRRVERLLPHTQMDLFAEYEKLVVQLCESMRSPLIVDVGAGRLCCFADKLRGHARIVAVDISEEELKLNKGVPMKCISDVSRIPIKDSSADLVVSRSVLEHLADVGSFLVEARRVLKAHGLTVHLFPSRFAPFALLNQLIPHEITKKLLLALKEGTGEVGTFPARYDHCYPSAFARLLEQNGFILRRMVVGYYQTRYFEFFLPAYVLSCAYEMAVRKLNLRNLCAYVLAVAERNI